MKRNIVFLALLLLIAVTVQSRTIKAPRSAEIGSIIKVYNSRVVNGGFPDYGILEDTGLKLTDGDKNGATIALEGFLLMNNKPWHSSVLYTEINSWVYLYGPHAGITCILISSPFGEDLYDENISYEDYYCKYLTSIGCKLISTKEEYTGERCRTYKYEKIYVVFRQSCGASACGYELYIGESLEEINNILGMDSTGQNATEQAQEDIRIEEPVYKKEEIKEKSSSRVFPMSDDDRIYDVVEQMPSFKGGQGTLMKWIASNLNYPVAAEEQQIEGRVLVQFVVEKDGSITNVKVIKSIESSLDNEAIRVVKSMPNWIPGRQNGLAVRVKYTVPVTFRLNL